jgi:hypothetical protein
VRQTKAKLVVQAVPLDVLELQTLLETVPKAGRVSARGGAIENTTSKILQRPAKRRPLTANEIQFSQQTLPVNVDRHTTTPTALAPPHTMLRHLILYPVVGPTQAVVVSYVELM